ncbi:HE65 [Lonomia obliqua multiple nucleopolyhedrovirus]|uniref:HE65 n=1 Tax=Lonomia obliqua multiple nucleopolyhedrovirus TaxID=134394 RepID=A0A126FCE8_9ABAC|nr:HE65 [Lonomia obliqua multiple nucleopolyhedrovirus]AKN81063.1 HE65 [Lonomia obliqua multiple nucleopolyhedrovirus]
MKFDIGSHAKGYALEDSDYDYIQIEPCTPARFMDHVFERRRFKNNHTKDADGNDVVMVNMFTALRGIYDGKFYYLGVFGCKREIIQDKRLYEFIRALTKARLPLILKSMADYAIHYRHLNKVKNLLAIFFNLSYINHCITINGPPDDASKINEYILKDKLSLYNSLMSKRAQNVTNCNESEIAQIEKYKQDTLETLLRIPMPGNSIEIEQSIVNYMLDE